LCGSPWNGSAERGHRARNLQWRHRSAWFSKHRVPFHMTRKDFVLALWYHTQFYKFDTFIWPFTLRIGVFNATLGGRYRVRWWLSSAYCLPTYPSTICHVQHTRPSPHDTTGAKSGVLLWLSPLQAIDMNDEPHVPTFECLHGLKQNLKETTHSRSAYQEQQYGGLPSHKTMNGCLYMMDVRHTQSWQIKRSGLYLKIALVAHYEKQCRIM
jgi:hypothetical protein